MTLRLCYCIGFVFFVVFFVRVLACLFHTCYFTRVGFGRFRVPESIATAFIVVCDNLQQMFGSFES